MSKYIPGQGDIVWLNFDPSAGSEIMKRRPAFVISREIFNRHTGFVMVAPITSTKRNNKFAIEIDSSYKTKGYILTYQVRTLDYVARNVERIESMSQKYIKQISDIVKLIAS